MKRVYKYKILPLGETEPELPPQARPLRVGYQGDELYLWAQVVDDQVTNVKRKKIHIFGTGHDIPIDFSYIDTVEDPLLPLIWHIYQELVL